MSRFHFFIYLLWVYWIKFKAEEEEEEGKEEEEKEEEEGVIIYIQLVFLPFNVIALMNFNRFTHLSSALRYYHVLP